MVINEVWWIGSLLNLLKVLCLKLRYVQTERFSVDCIQAKWGTHLLIEAARALFAEALKNPHNQRFVMLSESGIPLYSPLLIWQQLMSETKSRINACQHPVSASGGPPLQAQAFMPFQTMDSSFKCLGSVLEGWMLRCAKV